LNIYQKNEKLFDPSTMVPAYEAGRINNMNYTDFFTAEKARDAKKD